MFRWLVLWFLLALMPGHRMSNMALFRTLKPTVVVDGELGRPEP